MQKLLTWLQLCRFAAVFTAMADIFLGYLLTHPGLESGRDFGLLLASSSCLYLAGMVFNDVFDREVDALERPERPIPSGRVSVRGAVILGVLLLVAGSCVAFTVGTPSGLVAGLLVGCILLYDGLLKSTLLGPVLMGACRFLNVMLGASAVPPIEIGEPTVWALPQLAVAGGLGIYITGVTWFARNEADTSRRLQLGGAMLAINTGLIILIAFALHWPDLLGRSWNTALALACIGAVFNRRLLVALRDPAPGNVQAAIRTLLLSLIMLDGSLVFFVQEDRSLAIVVVLLLVPATILGRFLAIT